MNCKTYAQDCIYEPISERAREAGRGRHELSRRRKTLERSHLADGIGHSLPTLLSPGTGEPSPSRGAHNGDTELGSREVARSEPGVARILVSANGISSYHGRTSALFEDHVPDRQAVLNLPPRMSDDWVQRGLVAEAAKQRMWMLHILPFSKAKSRNRSNGRVEFPPRKARL